MKLSQILVKFNNQAYASPWKVDVINNLRLKKIFEIIGSNQKILDVGCYDGTIARAIQERKNEVIGIDIAPKAVQMAKKKGIKAYVCNIEENKIPQQLGKFDTILAAEIIEHIFDPDSFLRKLRTALKPKGHIILTTPNLAGLGSRLSLMLGKVPWMIENDILPGKSGHIRYFTYEELEKLLSRQGFKIVQFATDSVGINSLTLPFLNSFYPRLGRILIIKAQKV